MEGNYYFQWQSVAATGEVEGRYEQVIYGMSVVKAMEQFVSFHGGLEPDEDGNCLIITCISWSPV